MDAADSHIAEVIHGLREAIGENSMMAYVVMMTIRLIELHKVLKPTGNMFLHCDPTASHYLKIILDAIFHPKNFRNEIVWKRTNSPKSQSNRLGTQHDIILWFSKTDNYTYNKTWIKLDDKNLKPFRYNDNDGKGPYRITPIIAAGIQLTPNRKKFEFHGSTECWLYNKEKLERWWNEGRIYKSKNGVYNRKDYLSDNKGQLISDIWVDGSVAPIQSNERLGYPTQKPLALLERIIEMGSNEGDLVLDPFCGCGTTVHAAQKLQRKWIGIDVTHLSIGLIEYRLKEAFGIKPPVYGVPTTLESAKELAKRDKFQFEAWAVTRIDKIKPNEKQVGDRGVDGRGRIELGKTAKNKSKYAKVIVSVKGGKNLKPEMIRDLRGTIEREKAEFGIFMCITPPTKKMETEAAVSGFVTTNVGTQYPKIQIYTIQDYFNGKKPKLPTIEDYLDVTKETPRKAKPAFVKFDTS